MFVRHLSIVASALACCSGAALAQSFSYANFNSTAGLTLNGDATQAGGTLTIAPAFGSAKGSVFHTAPVNVSANFETTFEFRMTTTGLGADGIAFVIHNDPRGALALGGDGSTMGYGNQAVDTPIANSIAVEIDTYNAGTPWFDPSDNHISIHTNGAGDNNAYESLSIGAATPIGVDFNDGQVHKLTLRYTGSQLSVLLDGATTPLLSVAYSFTAGGTWSAGGAVGGLNLIGGTDAYVGVTAACGGLFQTHDLLSWSWTGSGSAPATYCTGGTSTSGCVASINASGQPSVAGVNPCVISISSVEGQKSGLVFYGVNNAGFTPLQWSPGSGSFLCVKPPTQRTPPQTSGGTLGQCNGALSLNWNSFQTAFPGALGQPWMVGEKVYAQGWYRDPPAPKTTNLSNAVELTYTP